MELRHLALCALWVVRSAFLRRSFLFCAGAVAILIEQRNIRCGPAIALALARVVLFDLLLLYLINFDDILTILVPQSVVLPALAPHMDV